MYIAMYIAASEASCSIIIILSVFCNVFISHIHTYNIATYVAEPSLD